LQMGCRHTVANGLTTASAGRKVSWGGGEIEPARTESGESVPRSRRQGAAQNKLSQINLPLIHKHEQGLNPLHDQTRRLLAPLEPMPHQPASHGCHPGDGQTGGGNFDEAIHE